MPARYRVIYFNAFGRAEVMRLLLSLVGEEFEDVRVSREEWPAMKKDAVFGQLPMVDVDGERFCQRKAMERLIARRHGLYGDTDMEQARADMVVDCIDDFLAEAIKAHTGSAEEKEKNGKLFHDQKCPDFLGKFEKLINSDGHFIGTKISWPDVSMFSAMQSVNRAIPINDVIKDFPKIKALYEKVENNPNIAQWLAKRPQTPF